MTTSSLEEIHFEKNSFNGTIKNNAFFQLNATNLTELTFGENTFNIIEGSFFIAPTIPSMERIIFGKNSFQDLYDETEEGRTANLFLGLNVPNIELIEIGENFAQYGLPNQFFNGLTVGGGELLIRNGALPNTAPGVTEMFVTSDPDGIQFDNFSKKGPFGFEDFTNINAFTKYHNGTSTIFKTGIVTYGISKAAISGMVDAFDWADNFDDIFPGSISLFEPEYQYFDGTTTTYPAGEFTAKGGTIVKRVFEIVNNSFEPKIFYITHLFGEHEIEIPFFVFPKEKATRTVEMMLFQTSTVES